MNNHIPKIAAVLFDMDGVLIDSNAVIERAWLEAAQMYSITISEQDMLHHIHGQPGPHTIRALFADLPIDDQQKVQAHIIDCENTATYDPIPGVAQLITSLHAVNIHVGIVTSGWREKVDRVTSMLGVDKYISVIVERDNVSRGKPFPDPYILAAQRLHLSSEQTLVFEDSRSGVTSAVAAGAFCVGIGNTELVECGAKLTIPDFTGVNVSSHSNGEITITFNANHALGMEKSTIACIPSKKYQKEIIR
ncbi:haloacid dehalogenase [Gilliamella sp. wkB178]|uniref:HAD family hydrolase n=1 Tax=Gilliamella sp. wkB178 TaxID=3120259 RepID=UPI00080D8D91|nr:HAD family phosphatase [Gilliamella apicola]OCG07892.1 haloacid dehalogenase [Gilliamella apicola]